MSQDEFKPWATFEFAPPEEVFPAEAWLVKKCIELAQNAGIQSWEDAEVYGQNSPYYCATLVVRAALGVTKALEGLRSPEAQDTTVRERYADQLRAASTTYGQAKERMLAHVVVTDTSKQTLVTLAKRGAGSARGLAKGRWRLEGHNEAQRSDAKKVAAELQQEANKVWAENPTLSKKSVAEYLVNMGRNKGLAADTIRQRIKHPKKS